MLFWHTLKEKKPPYMPDQRRKYKDVAGGDACVLGQESAGGQNMVRPGDRTSLKAGGDACVPGHTLQELMNNYTAITC